MLVIEEIDIKEFLHLIIKVEHHGSVEQVRNQLFLRFRLWLKYFKVSYLDVQYPVWLTNKIQLIFVP